MRVQVVMAWPRGCESAWVELAEGARVDQAVAAAALPHADRAVARAVFGVLATPDQVLHEGDRMELLRPLRVDPKEARRRRAART